VSSDTSPPFPASSFPPFSSPPAGRPPPVLPCPSCMSTRPRDPRPLCIGCAPARAIPTCCLRNCSWRPQGRRCGGWAARARARGGGGEHAAARASSSSPTLECWSVAAAQGGAPARRLHVPGHHGLRRRATPALGGPELLLPGTWCLLPFIALLRLRASRRAAAIGKTLHRLLLRAQDQQILLLSLPSISSS
jgi:hypothetical protein